MKIIIAAMLVASTVFGQGGPKFKIGVGFLNGFGGIGGGVEAEMRQIALLGGVGYMGTDDLSWDVGLRYYLRAVDKKLRPHASVSYGPTHVVQWGPVSNIKENSSLIFGFNILAGLDHDFGKRNGFVMTYGIGAGIPGGFPKKMEDRYQNAGQPLPSKPGVTPTGSLGIKYQF